MHSNLNSSNDFLHNVKFYDFTNNFFIYRRNKKEFKYLMKIPCTLNKFFVYDKLLSEAKFLEDWAALLHLKEETRIDGTIANSIEKLHSYFPFSHIYESKLNQEENSLLNEKNLYGKFQLIYYPNFEYYYKCSFNQKNTHLTMELSYSEQKMFDPRPKFIGEIILENYSRLFSPVF